jgi:hypothetical protein
VGFHFGRATPVVRVTCDSVAHYRALHEVLKEPVPVRFLFEPGRPGAWVGGEPRGGTAGTRAQAFDTR